MPTNTYVALATHTIPTAVTDYTFTSIPGTYTDLVLVANNYFTSGGTTIKVRLNGDSGSNYSWTLLQGNGSTAASVRGSNDTKFDMFGWNTNATSTNSGTVGTMSVMNYANTSTYKTVLGRHNWVSGETAAEVGLWRNTAAITSITLTTGGAQTIGAGSTFSLYGIEKGAAVATTAKATGGTITYASDGYTYHTFTSSGTFTPSANITCDYLVIAGGGGGSRINAGGGAGGLRSTVDTTGGGAALESAVALTSGTGYTVTVGAGGAGGNSSGGSNGSNSVFGSITSLGGGGGGPYVGSGGGSSNGFSGGSGGGAGFNEGTAVNSGGAGTSSQGYAGGGTIALYTSGGGGGAGGSGGVGVSQSNVPAGNGGVGARIPTFSAATGTGVNYYYAGGGGAGDEDFSSPAGVGGLGGGGNGANRTGGSTRNAGTAGTTNTGSGGGGGENGGTNGYAGGSGIVIIRYAN